MTGLFIAIVAIAIVAAVFGIIQDRKRRKALEAWAAQRGLAQLPGKDRDLRHQYPKFEALRQGDQDRYALNRMAGTIDGRRVLCFDYHYETRSRDKDGKTTTTSYYFSGVIVTHGLPFKPLLIRPEGLFDKFTAFVGFDDIDFELDAFSRAFFVKGPDKQFAFDVIHQSTMEFMLEAPRFTLDFEGPAVMIYRSSRFKPADFDQAFALADGILGRLPNYLLREMKGVD